MRIAPEPRPSTSASPRSLPELPDGQVLDDPVLHVLEPVVVGVEDGARLGDVEAVVGAEAHGTSISQSSYVRIHPCSGDCSEVRSSRPSSRSACSRTASGMPGSVDLLAELVGGVFPAAIAELLADRRHLLAEDQLALALLEVLATPRRGCVSFTSISASVSFAQARTISSRASTSIVSRTSTFRSKLRSGE